jgi:large subunit ribosomal protein L32e
MSTKRLLKIRRRAKKKKPEFRRQENLRHRRLKSKWRRPKGKQSKLRMGEKARGKKPSVGFSSPRKVRGLSGSGMKELRVFTPKDLEKAKGHSILIASSVGRKKRNEIIKKAWELGLEISNI